MININNKMVSVIMLTYNRENLVNRAIDSILVQTFHDFEFIIVDNGSTDKSGIVADEYALKDNRIRVIHRKRGNIGSGRNAGLQAAKSNYITFIDDDDWCEPDFLEFLYNLITENNADVSICGTADRTYDEKRIMEAEQALIELMRRKYYNMAFPTKMFKREFIDKIIFSENDMYDDISQMHKLLALSNKIAYHGLPKYTFYRHESNNSAWTTNHSLLNAETLDEYLRVYRNRTVWLSDMFPKSKAEWQYFEWSFMLSMIEKINRYNIKNCEKQYCSMLSELQTNREEFLHGKFIKNFEKEWFEEYLK